MKRTSIILGLFFNLLCNLNLALASELPTDANQRLSVILAGENFEQENELFSEYKDKIKNKVIEWIEDLKNTFFPASQEANEGDSIFSGFLESFLSVLKYFVYFCVEILPWLLIGTLVLIGLYYGYKYLIKNKILISQRNADVLSGGKVDNSSLILELYRSKEYIKALHLLREQLRTSLCAQYSLLKSSTDREILRLINREGIDERAFLSFGPFFEQIIYAGKSFSENEQEKFLNEILRKLKL